MCASELDIRTGINLSGDETFGTPAETDVLVEKEAEKIHREQVGVAEHRPYQSTDGWSRRAQDEQRGSINYR